MTLRRGLIASYAVLWIASTVFRQFLPASALRPGMRSIDVDPRVRVAYVDTAPGSGSSAVILLHGSPGSSEVFAGLLPLLPRELRTIVPDLPGFGASTRKVSDYSFRAHARYVLNLLDALGVRKVQVVGFSMGGGVALSMVDLAPGRVASVAMVSAIGVQEHELFGSYASNHLAHAVQLGALSALRCGTPHFGLFDRAFFSVEYARNFFDSDQRPLRRVLEGYRGPMLILHGDRDPHVPLAAAFEHHSIVPQSQLRVIEGDHYMVFQRPGALAPALTEFLRAHVRQTLE